MGGRSPVHLREDFCGTALICAEWVKGSIQRVATGLDLDLEALLWGIHNNVKKLGEDACSRVRLFHGNVLEPISMAQIIQTSSGDLVTEGKAVGNEEFPAVLSAHCRKHDRSENENGNLERDGKYSDAHSAESVDYSGLEKKRGNNEREGTDCRDRLAVTISWPGVDIVCALNYSCCCLQKRSDLVSYFKHVLEALSDRGGIFVMDIYGGVSSECPLKLRRHLQDFTYIWEQEAFDVINRTTRISLHFQLKNNRMLRQAFTYRWRLWSLPEVKDCLEEAGFHAIHFWVRKMPDMQGREVNEDVDDDDSKYEETKCFDQQSAWNAYIVAVALKKSCH